MKRLNRFCFSTVLAAGLALAGSQHAFATTVNFDGLADGTVINTHYAGVTFGNPLGSADIYARSSASAASPSNVVSVFQTGIPAFDSRWGAVEAVFGTAQRYVSIDAAILRVSEGLSSPINSPKLEIYTASGFLTSILWDFSVIPQPDVGAITGYQTLAFSSLTDNITKVRFLSSNPGESPSNFGMFDNLTFRAGNNDSGTVPEPGSLVLLATALTVAGFVRRRRSVM